jgi:hypothetical protein
MQFLVLSIFGVEIISVFWATCSLYSGSKAQVEKKKRNTGEAEKVRKKNRNK